MNTLLHFLFVLCQSCRSLRNVSFGGRILGLMKSAFHGWLSMMTSSEDPLCSLASGPPTQTHHCISHAHTPLNEKNTLCLHIIYNYI